MMKKAFIVFRKEWIQCQDRYGDAVSTDNIQEIARTETLAEAEDKIREDMERESDLAPWERHIAVTPDLPEGRTCYFVTEAYVMAEQEA